MTSESKDPQHASKACTVHWSKGGTAELIACSDDALTVLSSISSPPGSRLEGTLRSGPYSHALRIKVHQCKKRQELGGFVLQGRIIDATKELRALLRIGPASP
jgi:hypothetical protein